MIHQSKIKLEDIFNHLTNLKADLLRHQIEHNQNHSVIYFTNHIIKKIDLIEMIAKSYDSYNFKFIYNEINRLLIEDPELHGVSISVKKNMYMENFNYAKVGQIYHRI